MTNWLVDALFGEHFSLVSMYGAWAIIRWGNRWQERRALRRRLEDRCSWSCEAPGCGFACWAEGEGRFVVVDVIATQHTAAHEA